MCVCVCVSIASDFSETIKVINMARWLHRVLNILTLTYIQCHTDLYHENNKCQIISETVQAMHTKLYVKRVRPQVYNILSQSDDLALSSIKLTTAVSNLTKIMFKLYYNSHISDSI